MGISLGGETRQSLGSQAVKGRAASRFQQAVLQPSSIQAPDIVGNES